MMPRSIAGINKLPRPERRELYQRFIPPELLERFAITSELSDSNGRVLGEFKFETGSTDVVIKLRHEPDAPDPILYAHLTDTMNGQLHILLYIVNNPDSERFDVDRMPDGRATNFGLDLRNIPAEIRAMQAGLSPGQIHKGLRMMKYVVRSLEQFVTQLGQSMFFIEPLYYHNAIVFERYGFLYSQGRRSMEALHTAFLPSGQFLAALDGSTPFRDPLFANSIRGRSWALHDGIAGQPFSGVTMYKRVGKSGTIDTFPGGAW